MQLVPLIYYIEKLPTYAILKVKEVDCLMKKTYLLFLSFVMGLLHFLIPSTTFAEDSLPIERAPSQAEVIEDTFYQNSVDAISWIYERQGNPSELTASSSPVIAYKIEVKGDADYRVVMRLNGEEVDAKYDKIAGLVTYQTTNLTGSQQVSIAIEVYNQTYELTSWRFAVDPTPIEPFENQDLTLLSTIQDESITQMNHYRTALSLPGFTVSNPLQKAAQAHSNYLSINQVSGHAQSPSGIGYVGSNPLARGNYFGYLGSVGEGITYEKRKGSLGIEDLMDAPYHRLSIIHPKNTFAGVGYNNQGGLVVNYGAMSDTEQTADVVLYPYNKQNDAKVSWYAAENPNPLRFWGLDRIHVGYPISYAYFPEENDDELVVTNLSLKDSQNRDLPFYDVTPERDDYAKHHVFLIPKSPLKPGETYTVNVEAFAKDNSNNQRDISKEWSFTTAPSIDVQDIYFTKSQKTNFLHLAYHSGEDPDATIQVKKNHELYLEVKDKQQWTHKAIVAGNYTLSIESPLFHTTKEIPITIDKNHHPRFDRDGDWQVSLNEELPPPSIDEISVEPITNLSKEIVGQAAPNATVTMEVNGKLIASATASQDGLFSFPIQQLSVGTELQFYARNTAGEKSETISTIVTDVTGLDGYTNWTPSQTVPKTKDWTIHFNKEIDPTTVNHSNFHLQYNRQKINDIDLVLNNDKKSVTVKAPKDGYDAGKTYFLYIEYDILTRSGQSLSRPIKFEFTVPMEK